MNFVNAFATKVLTALKNCAREQHCNNAPNPYSALLAKYPFLDPDERVLIHDLASRIIERTGGVVYSGPFAEMKLVPNSFLTTRPIWTVGCYEQEIDEALCDLITNPPKKIIDIGSAHGFYMVGLATQIHDIPIIGFEADEKPHWLEARKLAELNNVSDRITQYGYCDTKSLDLVLDEGSAILCDCEGGELDILDPAACPKLKYCRILCELHDFYRPGVTGTLVNRFKNSHHIKLILEQKRDPSQFRILDGLTDSERILSTKESKHIPKGRTAARFLWLLPKANL